MADDLNPLLAIVLQAEPQLQDLQAAQANVAAYQEAVDTYTQKLADEQAKVTSIMASLMTLSDQFVAEYQSQSSTDTSGGTA